MVFRIQSLEKSRLAAKIRTRARAINARNSLEVLLNSCVLPLVELRQYIESLFDGDDSHLLENNQKFMRVVMRSSKEPDFITRYSYD